MNNKIMKSISIVILIVAIGILFYYVYLPDKHIDNAVSAQATPVNMVAAPGDLKLKDVINKYSQPDYTVVLAVRDEATSHLPADFVNVMRGKGSHIGDLQFRGSYIGIIEDGKLIQEKINNNGPSNAEIKVNNESIQATSAGGQFGDSSSIKVNGVEYSPNKRGFNIFVYNKTNNQGLVFNFDTFLLKMPSNAIFEKDHKDLKAALIENNRKDNIVILAVKDEAKTNLPIDFINEMKQKGSHIDQLQVRGSYLGIFQDGKLVQEQIDNKNAINLVLKLDGREIEVSSAGATLGNYAHIQVDKVEYSPNQRGFNMVVLNKNSTKVHIFSFDTYLPIGN